VPPSPPDKRAALIRALEADLVGPFLLDDAAPELLPLPPSRWYLTGFLAPEGSAQIDDATEEDDAGAGDDEEAQSKAPKRLPSSIGLSVLLPPGAGGTVTVTLSYAEYTLASVEPARAEGGAPKTSSASARQRWARRQAPPCSWEAPLDAAVLRAGKEIARGLWIEGHQDAEPDVGREPAREVHRGRRARGAARVGQLHGPRAVARRGGGGHHRGRFVRDGAGEPAAERDGRGGVHDVARGWGRVAAGRDTTAHRAVER
jgi:hypothetical protein